MTERRYTLTRIGTGDYWTLSNDEARLWRFHAYEDGAAHGLIGVSYERRTFWRACWVPIEAATSTSPLDLDSDPWSPPWIEDAWNLPTRRAAIERMMADTDARTRNEPP